MTNPFAAIVDRHRATNDLHALAATPAKSLQADETQTAAHLFALGFSTPRIETGLCEAYEAKKNAKRKPLRGGAYNPADATMLFNSHFFVGKNDQETGIFRINDDGSATFVPPEEFKLEVQNIFVVKIAPDGSQKKVPAEKFWRESAQRRELKLVFKPGGTTEPDEFNLWRGFGVIRRKTRRKILRLMRHIWKVICQSDRDKFEYLIRFLAWCVQNPDKPAEVVVVLVSRKQGTGKSTLLRVMRKIFGAHGALIDDKERLFGRFNDFLETVCFIAAEEILWAGDHKTADRLKSMLTAETIQIERKFGGVHQILNRLHMMMASNYDHAVSAGVGERRDVVYKTSDTHACDKSWFEPLYKDLDSGGIEEFLDFLLEMRLADWHPREILKTAETAEQQRMSGDSVSQWAQACINADAIIGSGLPLDLGASVSVPALQDAYTGYCKQNSLRPLGTDAFGKACADMFGPRRRLRALQTAGAGNKVRRPWGYQIPTGRKWQERVDARLGIK